MTSEQFKHVAVIGAGVMGHAIAQVFARAGSACHLVDRDESILRRAMDLIEGNLETMSEFGLVRIEEIPSILARVHPTTDLAVAVKGVDFALECVTEVPEVKKSLFAELEALCPREAILASNTSSLDIFSLVDLKIPERLVVAHWFAPPHIIPLVEVAPGSATSPDNLARTVRLLEGLGKRVVTMKTHVKDYIVNRLQRAIQAAAWEMIDNGWASPEDIDLAIKTSLGIRLPVVGVMQSMDFTGLDLLLDIARGRGESRPYIEEKVRQGHLGAKTSKGIYDYRGRTEKEILRSRDRFYLSLLAHLEHLRAFNPIGVED